VADELNASPDGGQLPASQVPFTESPSVSALAETGAKQVAIAVSDTSVRSFDFMIFPLLDGPFKTTD
jgi:hypothetical protein